MAKEFTGQNNYGWGLTFDMLRKVPAVSKRIFDTYVDALSYINNENDSAIEGLILSVVNDEEKNGAYFVKKIGTTSSLNGELVKIGESAIVIDNELNIVNFISEDINIGKTFYLSVNTDNYKKGLYLVNDKNSILKLGSGILKITDASDIAQLEPGTIFYLSNEYELYDKGLYLVEDTGVNRILNKSEIENIISNAVSTIIDGAPTAYDTLNEIAKWIAEGNTGTGDVIEAVNNAVKELKIEFLGQGAIIKGIKNNEDSTTSCMIPYADTVKPGIVNSNTIKQINAASTAKGTTLVNAIQIDGGPLASNAVKNVFSNNIIPAGTSIEDVLRLLLNKIQFPEVTSYSSKLNITLTSLNIGNLVNNKIYNLDNPTVTIPVIEEPTVSINTNGVKHIGMSYGYKIGDVTYKDKTSYSLEVTEKNSISSSAFSYKLNGNLLNGNTFNIRLGKNELIITYTVNGTFEVKGEASEDIYVLANDGNVTVNGLSKVLEVADLIITRNLLQTSKTFNFYGMNRFKFNAKSCNYELKGADIDESYDGKENTHLPDTYNTNGITVTLYLNYGNSQGSNSDSYVFKVPKNLTISSFKAKLFDLSLPNPWDGTTDMNYTLTTDGDYNKYDFGRHGSSYYGIKVSVTFKIN